MQEQGFGKGRAGAVAPPGGAGVWRVPSLLDERLWPEVKGDYSREREIQRERRSTCPERLAKSATDGSLGGGVVVAVAAVVVTRVVVPSAELLLLWQSAELLLLWQIRSIRRTKLTESRRN